jgi:hypothetical protein
LRNASAPESSERIQPGTQLAPSSITPIRRRGNLAQHDLRGVGGAKRRIALLGHRGLVGGRPHHPAQRLAEPRPDRRIGVALGGARWLEDMRIGVVNHSALGVWHPVASGATVLPVAVAHPTADRHRGPAHPTVRVMPMRSSRRRTCASTSQITSWRGVCL